jgi:GNAT superfamily N-acetyltransferase
MEVRMTDDVRATGASSPTGQPTVSTPMIIPAARVDEAALHTFFAEYFPERGTRMNVAWRWLNRASTGGDSLPLVATTDGRVVAYVGAMPFRIRIDGVERLASWKVDWGVLPETRGTGIGGSLADEYRRRYEVCTGFSNQLSLQLLSKRGWKSAYPTPIHYHLLRPFGHPRARAAIPGIWRVLDAITAPLLALPFVKHAKSIQSVHLEALNAGILPGLLDDLPSAPPGIGPERSDSFLQWRLLDSPHSSMYHMVRVEGSSAWLIVKHYPDPIGRSLDVLLTGTPYDKEGVTVLVATLARWGSKQGYSHLRMAPPVDDLAQHLARTLRPRVRRPVFVFHADDPAVLEALERGPYAWELIDNDFESLWD